jgi:hypothetical protein
LSPPQPIISQGFIAKEAPGLTPAKCYPALNQARIADHK